jgi:hypothetical protein
MRCKELQKMSSRSSFNFQTWCEGIGQTSVHVQPDST